MNLNQEFHKHLQAGRVSAAITLVVGQLVELKITTKATSGRLHTTIDLLSGQITNTVDPAFFTDKASQKLLEFHTNQITATSQVVREQLRSLQDLLQALPQPDALDVTVAKSVDSLANSARSEITANPQPSETLPVALTDTLPVMLPIDNLEANSSRPETPIIKASESLPTSQPEISVVKALDDLPTSQPEISVVKALDDLPTSQPEISVVKAPDDLPTSQPEIPVAKAPDDLPTSQSEIPIAKTPENSPIETYLEPVPSSNNSVIEEPEQAQSKQIAPKPPSRVGIASGLAAALSKTSALDPSEAATIPNKFDQALKLAGVLSTNQEEDSHPFRSIRQQVAAPIDVQPVIDQPTELIPKRELIDLLSDSEEDWDEWLLEEDILSELSDATKNQMPDLEAHWLSATTPTSAKSSPSDWEEFMPEYPDVNNVINKNQANVERFRQNLVNDPQLMSELLAELDDLEKLENTRPQP
jgi:hypothetical protein